MKDVNKCRLNVSPGIEDSVHWGIEPERHSAHRLFICLSFPGLFKTPDFFTMDIIPDKKSTASAHIIL